MMDRRKWIYIAAGGVASLTLMIAVGFFFVESGTASALPQIRSAIGMHQKMGWGLNWGPGDEEPPLGDRTAALAEALGISVEELESAMEQAREMALQEAVSEGLLTEEQAEEIRNRQNEGPRFRKPFMGPGMRNSKLAEVLGISESELAEAQQAAHETLLSQAVEDGNLTQEQADLVRAGMELRNYLPSAMENAFEEALQNAVDDGVITQAQADQLAEAKESGFPGLRGRRHHGAWSEKDG